jgi:hypothetical protein
VVDERAHRASGSRLGHHDGKGDDVNLVDELSRVTRIEEIIGLGEYV